jgi:hypothetical protein
MNIQQPIGGTTDLKGLKVLVMLPSSTEERADYLARLVQVMKDRWDWRLSVLCARGDVEAFRPLTEPHGQIFASPHFRKPHDWENDPQASARIDELLFQAELAAEVTVGQLVLGCAANIGSSFTLPYTKQKHSNLAKRALADNSEPFRLFRRLYGFAEQVLDEAQPDLIVAYEWAKPWRANFWLAGARRNIPRVAIRRSKLNGGHYFWTQERAFYNQRANDLAERKSQSGAAISDRARERIENFQQRPVTVQYVREKWDMLGRRSWVQWHRNFASVTAKKLARVAIGKGKISKLNLGQAVTYNRSIIQARRDQVFFRSYDEAQLASMKYIYFPMHKETDSPLIFQAQGWHDQRNTLHVLAASLPSGYRLLAREHRLNVGLRPAGYYENLSRLPNFDLIDPFGDQFPYIRNASLVVTENGSSGWEALMLRRPTITLSRTIYDGAGLSRKVGNPDLLPAAVLKALSEPAMDRDEYQRRLCWMIDAEFETTFSMKLDRVADGADKLESILAVALPDPGGAQFIGQGVS